MQLLRYGSLERHYARLLRVNDYTADIGWSEACTNKLLVSIRCGFRKRQSIHKSSSYLSENI